MQIRYFLITGILLAFFVCPALAGTLYISQGPSFSAAISGSNQFTPGQDIALPVKIENRGLTTIKLVQSGYIERDDLPNTAKFVTIGLGAGNTSVTVKSDPQMLGDIAGGKSIQAVFNIKIPRDATSGDYYLPLSVEYQYLASAEQNAQDVIEYHYQTKNVVLSLPIKIEKNVVLGVTPVQGTSLNVGTEGYLVLDIVNNGQEDAHDAIIKVIRNGNSPITPTDSSVYIGEFPAGNTTRCKFKVSVSRDAEAQDYPLDVVAVYKDHEGDMVTSTPVTVGIPVQGKIAFDVVGTDSVLNPGKKKVISVTYKNAGNSTAYSAQARVSVIDPFSSNDDSAFLGDVAPGQTAVARYEISVDQGAVAKNYSFDSEVRYRDSLDNSQISDTVKVPVTVAPMSLTSALVSYLPYILIGIIIVVAAAYYLLVMRKKK